MADIEETELSDKQKNEIAKWFLLNSPVGEIQYVAKGLFSLSLWFFDFLIFDFWFLEFGFALAFFFYDFSDLHFVLCVVLISWLFVHFGIFFFVLFGFFGRCESDTKRRRIVQRGSFGGVSVVQQITHDLPRNARPSRRCESLNL